MGSQGLLLDIQLSYNQFTKTEKKIADYVLKSPDQVLFMSITELADECHVAEASVHRFCRTVGAKGYQEFKMKLSLSLAPDDANGDLLPEDESHDGNLAFFDSILQYHLGAIRETNRLLDPDVVEETVEMMLNSDNIFFFGIGDSLITAEEARNKFLRITPKVQTILDPHMQAMAASMLTEKDMVFFVSYSGATKDTVFVAQIARRAGAKISAISRFLKSPLTEYADTVLICGSNEGPLEGGSMGAMMSQLHIIDILFECYRRKAPEATRENKRKTSGAVAEKLY